MKQKSVRPKLHGDSSFCETRMAKRNKTTTKLKLVVAKNSNLIIATST